MINQIDPTMIIKSRIIQSKKIQPPIESWDQVKDRQGQSLTIILKALMKAHITLGSQTSKEKLGAISHMYMPKTSISSRIQNFRRGGLRIFQLYGQIKWEVVVGTKLS